MGQGEGGGESDLPPSWVTRVSHLGTHRVCRVKPSAGLCLWVCGAKEGRARGGSDVVAVTHEHEWARRGLQPVGIGGSSSWAGVQVAQAFRRVLLRPGASLAAVCPEGSSLQSDFQTYLCHRPGHWAAWKPNKAFPVCETNPNESF